MQRNMLVLLGLCTFFISSIYCAPTTGYLEPTAPNSTLFARQQDENGFHHLSRRDLPSFITEWPLWEEFERISRLTVPEARPIPKDTLEGKDVSSKERERYRYESNGRWEVSFGQRLGSGTFGTVYSGVLWSYDQRSRGWIDKGTYAIKKSKTQAGDLIRGAELANEIKSDYFLKPKSWFYVNIDKEPNGFLVLPKATRGDLRTMIRSNTWPDLTRKQKNKIFRNILIGVEAMHKKGIMHRDLKPGNILMFDGFTPKIADFDFMTSKESSGSWLIGTPGYIAPEIVKTKKYTKAVDVFALGMIWLEMLVYRMQDSEVRLQVWKRVIGPGEWNFNPLGIDNILVEMFEGLITEAERKLLSSVLCGPQSRITITDYVNKISTMLE